VALLVRRRPIRRGEPATADLATYPAVDVRSRAGGVSRFGRNDRASPPQDALSGQERATKHGTRKIGKWNRREKLPDGKEFP